MTRVKRGFVARKRRNRVLKLAKGFRGSHSVLFRTAQQRTMRALSLSYSDRRLFKRSMRRLWIRRINSFVRNTAFSNSVSRSLENTPNNKGLTSMAVHKESSELHSYPINYSGFINQLKKSNIVLNRKVLAQLAVFDPVSLSFLAGSVTPKL